MAKLKKLIGKSDSKVNTIGPLSNEDILKRQTDYPLLGEVDSKSIQCNDIPTNEHEGIRYVYCLTNLSRLSSMELAEMLYKVVAKAKVIFAQTLIPSMHIIC